jgi:hypothetical protein
VERFVRREAGLAPDTAFEAGAWRTPGPRGSRYTYFSLWTEGDGRLFVVAQAEPERTDRPLPRTVGAAGEVKGADGGRGGAPTADAQRSWCQRTQRTKGRVIPWVSWGRLDKGERAQWQRFRCDERLGIKVSGRVAKVRRLRAAAAARRRRRQT